MEGSAQWAGCRRLLGGAGRLCRSPLRRHARPPGSAQLALHLLHPLGIALKHHLQAAAAAAGAWHAFLQHMPTHAHCRPAQQQQGTCRPPTARLRLALLLLALHLALGLHCAGQRAALHAEGLAQHRKCPDSLMRRPMSQRAGNLLLRASRHGAQGSGLGAARWGLGAEGRARGRLQGGHCHPRAAAHAQVHAELSARRPRAPHLQLAAQLGGGGGAARRLQRLLAGHHQGAQAAVA